MRNRSRFMAWAVGGALVVVGLVAALSLGGDTSGRVQAQANACPTPSPSTTATPGPGANFSVSIGGPCAGNTGQPVTFTASLQNAGPSSADVQFFWTFGDGSAVASGNPVQHTFMTAGTFTVSVAAQGNGRSATSATTAVIAQSLPITAGGPYTGNIGQTINFSATSTGMLPADTTFTWDFGDGTPTATGQTVAHIYNTTGVFNVTLTAASATAGRTGLDKTTATIGLATATPSPTATASPTPSPTPSPTASPTPTGPTQTYQPGWNLVGGANGQTFPGAAGPLYTYQAGDTNYQILPQGTAIQAGKGYWAYFNGTTTVSLAPTSGSSTLTISVPVNQYIMVGNPSQTQAVTISGADFVYIYDPSINNYVATTTLAPGRGAWVLSINGGTVTLAP